MSPVNLLELDRNALVEYCGRLGEKPFRATQLFRWIHHRGVADFGAMSDLAKSLREKLAGQAHVAALPLMSEQASAVSRHPGGRRPSHPGVTRRGLLPPLTSPATRGR